MVRPFPSTKEGTLSEKGFSQIFSFLKTQDIAAIGPGLGRHASTKRLVRKLLVGSSIPLVVDADGVNALVGNPRLLKNCKAEMVLTPHPGEFVRAFGGRKPGADSERKRRALEVAKKFKKILVLKGYRTVVAAPHGKVFVNPTGNPGMATGGTGDVLTGIIAALIGQGIKPYNAARFGVYLHGLAGDLAARKRGEASLVASDLLDFLPQAIQSVL
jgi:NAD(P)H-hydrate epimerase